jgi:hypothetical protein
MMMSATKAPEGVLAPHISVYSQVMFIDAWRANGFAEGLLKLAGLGGCHSLEEMKGIPAKGFRKRILSSREVL